MGLEFIGPLNLASSIGNTHILTSMDYFTKWVEITPVKKTTSKVVRKFLMENILVRFSVLEKLVTNNVLTLSLRELQFFFYGNGIFLSYSSNYFPHGNGREKYSNKNLISNMRKLVSDNMKDWQKGCWKHYGLIKLLLREKLG